MDSKLVNKSIKKIIWLFLEEQGFSKFTSRNAWRFNQDTIEVVNFQSFNSFLAQVLDCTTYSFAVNLGIYFTKIPDRFPNIPIKIKDGFLLPDECSCHLRKNLLKSITQDDLKIPNVWYIDSMGDNITSAINDVKKVLISDGLKWFEKYSKMVAVLEALQNEDEQQYELQGIGRIDSPIRCYTAGYIASFLEDYELASSYLKKAINSGCFNAIERILQRDYERFKTK